MVDRKIRKNFRKVKTKYNLSKLQFEKLQNQVFQNFQRSEKRRDLAHYMDSPRLSRVRFLRTPNFVSNTGYFLLPLNPLNFSMSHLILSLSLSSLNIFSLLKLSQRLLLASQPSSSLLLIFYPLFILLLELSLLQIGRTLAPNT